MKQTLGIGVLGTGWMAKAHTQALRRLATLTDLPVDLRLVVVGGRDAARTSRRARAWGFERASTDWRDVVDDPAVDVLVNLTGNHAHAAPSIAALERGLHVLCEKPLATDPRDVRAMVESAAASTGVAACGYNYRLVPAVRMIRDLIASGEIGGIRAASFGYEQDWAAADDARNGWRFDDVRGGSALYDLSHILDLTAWILGDPIETVGTVTTRTSTGARPCVLGVEPEDAFTALVRTADVTASVTASRIATGRKAHQFIEITGSAGAVTWDMEDLNRLRLWLPGNERINGFRDVLVTEPDHPYMRHWYAPGHTIGWDDTVAHQWLSFISAITGFDESISADLASFGEGARAIRFADAIRRSARTRTWEPVAGSSDANADDLGGR